MRTLIDNGGPAFPSQQGHTPDGTWNQTYDPGISMRDYFAAAALPALIMASQGVNNVTRNDVVAEAYHVADTMLHARQSQPAP